MKSMMYKGLVVFFILFVATSMMMDVFKLEFGTVNFFERHGVAFLIFITFFPRLTLLFSSVVSGGVFWWPAFLFCPRILVASLATVAYFHTNPFLVTMSWLVAIGGEFFEKYGIGPSRKRFVFRTYRMGGEQHPSSPIIRKDDAIEAEFRKG